jgi:very-short-patch-repair endonuclease
VRRWYALRDRRFHGIKFRRQQPIGSYVADFICFEAKLVIELDGSRHAFPEDGVMETIGLAVFHLTRA